jgi:AAA domain-containing protein
MNSFHSLDRKEFRGLLDAVLHPSENIFQPDQLKGREKPLRDMLDCFETPGAQAFIWGPRGVGKTSLGHTSCEKHGDTVDFAAAVACEKETTISQLLTDILRSVLKNNQVLLKDKSLAGSLSAFGIKLSGAMGGFKESFIVESPNQAVALLNSIFPVARFPDKIPVVIIDEFDRLENSETLRMFSSILKQISVDGIRLNFVFCGVAKNLNELLGAHESVERYVYGVELTPLTHGAVWEIVEDVEQTFAVSFNRGQKVRIGQIASGYAHFAHLILKNILLCAFEAKFTATKITAALYKTGVHESTQQAATRLKSAYERATKRGTDRYIEVLWAIANDKHLDRQFKAIQHDYDQIMKLRPGRNGYDTKTNNGIALRNALNALHKGGFLEKGKSGWYQFVDPMFRSYVRMIAERDDIELGDESFAR